MRLGHVTTAGTATLYRLCGEFLPAPEGGPAEWTAFATIRTSGYEHWLGAQAAAFCQDRSVSWDEVGDLTPSLQREFDSLS